MTVIDQQGNHHGKDGKFSQKPRMEGSELDTCPPNVEETRIGDLLRRVSHDNNGSLERWYNKNKQLHRVDKPAETCYRPDGSIASETWHKNGQPHRDNGPAVTYYDQNNMPTRQEWWRNGQPQKTRDSFTRQQQKYTKTLKNDGKIRCLMQPIKPGNTLDSHNLDDINNYAAAYHNGPTWAFISDEDGIYTAEIWDDGETQIRHRYPTLEDALNDENAFD